MFLIETFPSWKSFPPQMQPAYDFVLAFSSSLAHVKKNAEKFSNLALFFKKEKTKYTYDISNIWHKQ